MFSIVQIVNLGLSKLGASRVSRIDPPASSLERFVAENYPHWKRSELAKRRWVFALEKDVLLTLEDTLDYGEKPYKFGIPVDCVRIIRSKYTEWEQRRRSVYSVGDTLRIDYIVNAPEAEFDALFVEVLACRVALECSEYVTQSNSKTSNAEALYRTAVTLAGQANAFVIGPEDIQADDSDFAFLTGRL